MTTQYFFKKQLSAKVATSISILFLSITFLTACYKTHKIAYFSGTLKEVFAKAKSENKKVFILMSDSACGKCKAFADYLDTQEETVDILARDYVCVKPDAHTSKDHHYFEILRNPSYPFPYLFDAKGNLLAFGFPNEAEFKIKDLSKIQINDFFFKETFDMDMSSAEYKNMISDCMKATLLLNEHPDSVDRAFELYRHSANTYVYPYNLRNLHLLSVQLGRQDVFDELKKKYRNVPPDRIIYGQLEEYRFLNNLNNKFEPRAKDIIKLDKQEVEIGELKKGVGKAFLISFNNISGKPLIISKIEHPCDCIKFKWTSKTISPNGSGAIEGIFTPYATGDFNKEIYIHTTSPAVLMVKANIRGTVK